MGAAECRASLPILNLQLVIPCEAGHPLLAVGEIFGHAKGDLANRDPSTS
jgi:hypothetical protein